MKVYELMHLLASMPRDAEVMAVYDGAARTNVGAVWQAQTGSVLLAEDDDHLWDEADYPPKGELPRIKRWASPPSSN